MMFGTTIATTVATGLNDWLARLATGREAALRRGAERFAALVSPDVELEKVAPPGEGTAPVVTLTVMSGLHRGATMELEAGEYLVGSGDDCDIALRDREVKPHHCRLTREWYGFSLHDLRGGNAQPIAPQTVNYDGGEIEAVFDIGGLSLSLRQPPPSRPAVVSQPLARTRWSWVMPAIIAGLVVAIAIFVLAKSGSRQAQLPVASRIVAGNLALIAQGFGSVHFRGGNHGELEVVGLVTDVAERGRLYEWLRRGHYADAHIAVQAGSELIEQARRAIAAEGLQVDVHAGRLRIEGTTSERVVKDRIRTLTQDLQSTVPVEDHVTFVAASERSPPTPPFPVRLRGVMVGNPSYFLTDQGARYFVGGVLPDGAEVLAIDKRQIRFAVDGKVIVYNLE